MWVRIPPSAPAGRMFRFQAQREGVTAFSSLFGHGLVMPGPGCTPTRSERLQAIYRRTNSSLCTLLVLDADAADGANRTLFLMPSGAPLPDLQC